MIVEVLGSTESVKDFKIPPYFENSIKENLFRKFRFPEGESFMILTDDYNPSDYFYSRLKENFRLRIRFNGRLSRDG